MNEKQITALIAWAVIATGAFALWTFIIRRKYGTMELYPFWVVLFSTVWFWWIFGTDFLL